MADHVDKIKKKYIYMSEVPFCLSKIHFNTCFIFLICIRETDLYISLLVSESLRFELYFVYVHHF